MVSAAGPELLKKLGIDRNKLLPTTQRIRSVNRTTLRVLGYLYTSISVRRTDGTNVDAHEAIYIVDNAPALFLSLACCKALTIVTSTFPSPAPPDLYVSATTEATQQIPRSPPP